MTLSTQDSALRTPIIALTAGEPAGIGPDLCVLLAQQKPAGSRIVAIANRGLLVERAAQLGLPLELVDFSPAAAAPDRAGVLEVLHRDLSEPALAGKLNPANSRYVLDTLTAAAQGCLDGAFDAMVTAPVHKGIINDAGIPFTGHTEFLAEMTGTSQVVMMLVGGGLRVALATTHLPLKDVSAAITRQGLEQVIRILHRDLKQRFALANPRILVAGLNPHAGESGHMGREEIDVIAPVLKSLRAEGMDLVGPLPADTLFTRHQLLGSDCQLAMYHDQGLPVLKFASFGGGVNVTLGMPIIRTSVDHGTALSLAGTGKIESGSLTAAIQLALEMARNQKAARP
ncbi:MAG: 4-hydroxythreonine-4-phosphate dehydrogenase PdxA [Gammaproteobacteria bacterium]|nr:4-hydroxythreonine-4-phosphate dehydrogenase PdxA [Gammaproteobacteria bacterium]MBU1980127.1 4-hydroxythreonine-4-phosphate dehydrogenase PdxA [Gammaproteobacteria bacterium]